MIVPAVSDTHSSRSTDAHQEGRSPSGSPLPYLAPILTFLLIKDLGGRVDESWRFAMLVLQVLIPACLLATFRVRGCYPEWKLRLTRWSTADLGVGVLLAAAWVLPFVWFPELRPADPQPFDATMLGASMATVVIALRWIGYALVTPVMEELFMRSFLIRLVDIWDDPRASFRDVPIGQYRLRSFIAVIVVFLATHVTWEWSVMLPWATVTTLWLYYRKDLMAIILVHAGTNAAILLSAVIWGGEPIEKSWSLWCLV